MSGYPEVAMTVERSNAAEPREWLITIERGNADEVQTLLLSDLERAQLAAMLSGDGSLHVTFRDVTCPEPGPA